MIFDSHAHYNYDAFDDDRDELLRSLKDNNVGAVMNCCTALDEMELIYEMCDRYPFMYGSVGIHPNCAIKIKEHHIEEIIKWAEKDKILAIGEIGLDYYHDDVPKDIQKACFDTQLSIASRLQMPVVVHNREAHKDSLDMVSAYKDVIGVFHCFSGSKEMAREVLSKGYYISLGGALTFKNNVKTVDVASYVPLDRILVETDCPFLTPVPFRGKRNNSSYIKYVIDKIAQIKGVSAEEVENVTFNNARTLFGI